MQAYAVSRPRRLGPLKTLTKTIGFPAPLVPAKKKPKKHLFPMSAALKNTWQLADSSSFLLIAQWSSPLHLITVSISRTDTGGLCAEFRCYDVKGKAQEMFSNVPDTSVHRAMGQSR